MINNSIFSFILNNFSEYVMVIDCNKKSIFQSDKLNSLFGYNFNETEIITIESLFNNSKIKLDDLLTQAKNNSEFSLVTNLKHQTKNFINLEIRIIYKTDPNTNESIFIFYFKDNTLQNFVKKDFIKKILTLENLSKSQKIRDGQINEAIYEILESSSRSINVTRVNAWIFNNEKTEIQCIGNYDAREHKLIPQSSLPCINMPQYFKAFEKEKIILSSDALNDQKIIELRDNYLIPLNIQSLMDIPIRIEGEIIGVVCFENIGFPREWAFQEQNYGLVVSQMLSLTIESHNKQKVKYELEIALNEKNILLQEVNHRVKNNLSIVASLINLQSQKSNDNYHKQLFIDCRNRLDSIAMIHELIYKAKSYAELNFKDYLSQIIDHISESYHAIKNIKISQQINNVQLNLSFAIPLALIVNELITNAFKHAFTNTENGTISVSLKEENTQVILTIEDNGQGFDQTIINDNSIGMDILNGLVDQISGVCAVSSNKNGSSFKITFSKN